jgi:hypothetical protein
MTILMPLFEPKTAEYIYIDEANHVHLLMPIVGGETIGIDNTCKTAMEMQAFFYGKDDLKKKSALDVLNDYAGALQKDIDLLMNSGQAPELLEIKRSRLIQIQGYTSILTIVKDKFVRSDAAFPKFPTGVHSLLNRKTNCFSMQLSPRVTDSFLRTQSPVFSLTRSQVVQRNGYYVDQVPDQYEGLGPSCRAELKSNLATLTGHVKTPKDYIISEVATHFMEQSPPPNLDALKVFIINKIREKFGETVRLDSDSAQWIVDESYFSDIFCQPYDECSTAEATNIILSACLADEFWSGRKQDSLFIPDSRIMGALNTTTEMIVTESERLTITAQFYLAQINIYCRSQHLSNKNFGPVFDSYLYRDSIARRISSAIKDGANVEDELFNLVNGMRLALDISRELTQADKEIIIRNFTTQFNTIKESPHFDEFIIFMPEVRGDFFNHKNRVSLHFLDFLKESPLSVDEKRRIQHTEAFHQLAGNVMALKAMDARHLRPDNQIPSSTFASFLNSINERTYRNCADLLRLEIQDSYSLVKKIPFDELELLINNPYWMRMKSVIIDSDLVTNDQGKYTQAIDYAKNWLEMMHEKIIYPRSGLVDSACILDHANWKTVIDAVIKDIQFYKSKFSFRFKRNERKAQIIELEGVLARLRTLDTADATKDARIQALHIALRTFASINKSIGADRSIFKRSGLQEKISGLQQLFLTTFKLEHTALQGNSLDAAQNVIEYENSRLEDFQDYTCLHGLKASWWSKEALEAIKKLPPSYYTPAMVDYLNTIDPVALDLYVLKTLQKDSIKFDGAFDLAALRFLGQFLDRLGDEPRYSVLMKLDKKWWADDVRLELIKSILPGNLTPSAVSFLNAINPEDLDTDVWTTLLTEQINFEGSTIERLRSRGVLLSYLNSKDISDQLKISLQKLNISWESATHIDKLLTLPLPEFPPTLIDFLNKIQPKQLSDDLILGIKQWNGTDQLTIAGLKKLSKSYVEKPRNTSPITPIFKSTHDKIIESAINYSTHVSNKWCDPWSTGKKKNRIIQEDLGAALTALRSQSSSSNSKATLEQVKIIIELAKTKLETKFGKKSWSWFSIKYILPESSRLLNELIEAVTITIETHVDSVPNTVVSEDDAPQNLHH